MTLPHACPERDVGRALRGCPDLGERAATPTSTLAMPKRPKGARRVHRRSGKAPPCRGLSPKHSSESCSFQEGGSDRRRAFPLVRDPLKFQSFGCGAGGAVAGWAGAAVEQCCRGLWGCTCSPARTGTRLTCRVPGATREEAGSLLGCWRRAEQACCKESSNI